MKRCFFRWRTLIPTCLQLQSQPDSSLLPLHPFLPPHRPARHANTLTGAHRNHIGVRASSKIISELVLASSAAKGDGPVSQTAFQWQRGCELPPPSHCTPSSWLCAAQNCARPSTCAALCWKGVGEPVLLRIIFFLERRLTLPLKEQMEMSTERTVTD